jgi:hypothetical protein
VNTVRTCQIKLISGGTAVDRETGNRGRARALECKEGDLIGAECAMDTEPFIVCDVIGTFKKWTGESGRSWMGEIRDGDEYLTCRKWQKRSGTIYMQCSQGTKANFYLLADDVRIVFTKHAMVVPPARARRSTAATPAPPPSCQLDEGELATLEARVYVASRDA